MARRARVLNAIATPSVSKPSRIPSTPFHRRQVSFEQIRVILQSHAEGSSLRGVSRTAGVTYNTGVSLIRATSQKVQLVHNAAVQAVETDAISTDELWSFVKKT